MHWNHHRLLNQMGTEIMCVAVHLSRTMAHDDSSWAYVLWCNDVYHAALLLCSSQLDDQLPEGLRTQACWVFVAHMHASLVLPGARGWFSSPINARMEWF